MLPTTDAAGFANLAERLVGAAERQYLMGAAVAGVIAPAASWSGKVNLMLDLADAAPQSPQARALAFQVLEQPLAEVLGSTMALNELLGPNLDLGGFLAALTRLSAAETVELLIGVDPNVARSMPPLDRRTQASCRPGLANKPWRANSGRSAGTSNQPRAAASWAENSCGCSSQSC